MPYANYWGLIVEQNWHSRSSDARSYVQHWVELWPLYKGCMPKEKIGVFTQLCKLQNLKRIMIIWKWYCNDNQSWEQQLDCTIVLSSWKHCMWCWALMIWAWVLAPIGAGDVHESKGQEHTWPNQPSSDRVECTSLKLGMLYHSTLSFICFCLGYS